MTGTERAELKAETLMRASARYGRTATTTYSSALDDAIELLAPGSTWIGWVLHRRERYMTKTAHGVFDGQAFSVEMVARFGQVPA